MLPRLPLTPAELLALGMGIVLYAGLYVGYHFSPLHSRDERIDRMVRKALAGLGVVGATAAAAALAPAAVRFPVIVGVASVAAGFARTFSAVLDLDHPASGRANMAVLRMARSPMWWSVGIIGTGAAFVCVWQGAFLGWFLLTVPSMTLLGFSAGAWTFYDGRESALPLPEIVDAVTEGAWHFVVVWGGVIGALLAMITAALIDGPPMVWGLLLSAGLVLGVAAAYSWRDHSREAA